MTSHEAFGTLGFKVNLMITSDSAEKNSILKDNSLEYLDVSRQRCQPGTTPICKIMTKNPYNLQKNPYQLSTPLQNTILA